MTALETADTAPAPDAEADHERECVEQVFRLTGGELSDEPWEPWVPSEMVPDPFDFEYATEGSKRTTFRYWYDGLPDYVGRREFPDQYDASYRTVVDCEMYGESPAVVYEAGVAWHKVAVYRSSGETECPGQHEDEGNVVTTEQRLCGTEDGPGRCTLCEEPVGEEHGYIYLGDGWSEVVYRSVDLPGPLGDGFDVGTVVWSKHRIDDEWASLIVAAGPAPEEFEGWLVVADVNREYIDDGEPYIDAEYYEEVKS